MAGQISDTATLFTDDFSNVSFYKANWDYNHYQQKDNPSFLGRTQMQQQLPTLVNGELRLRVDTWLDGKAFSGDEAITKMNFNLKNGGVAFETTARFDSANVKGLVGGMFPFGITTGKKKNEIDWEGMSNKYLAGIKQIQTNVYANENPGAGTAKYVNVPDSLYKNHVYRIEWMKDQVRWLIDGQVVRTETQKVPPNGDVQLHLNFWVPGSDWGAAYDAGLKPAASKAQSKQYYFYVDKVAVTQLSAVYGDNKGNTLSGTEHHDRIRGHASADTLDGGAGDDTLIGNRHKDTLLGGHGDDTLEGGKGRDRLNGHEGDDHLHGGSGADTFVFDTDLALAGVDHIRDFKPGVDKISLSGTVFAGIGPAGALAGAAFHIGVSAADADDRIIYDKAARVLKFDPDGNGPAAEVVFATVKAGLALTAADIVVG